MAAGGRFRRLSRRAAAGAAVLVLLACSSPEPVGDTPEDGPPPTRADGSLATEASAVAGVVVDADREPVAGATVSVVAGATVGDHGAAFAAFLFTAGFACLADGDVCDPGDEHVASVSTGDDGRYDVVLPDAYLPGYETDTDWVVTAALAPGEGQLTGPASSFEFEVRSPRHEAPDLPLWRAAPSVEPGTLVAVGLEPPRVVGGTASSTTVTFVDEQGAPVWEAAAATVDARLLEDVPLRVLGVRRADLAVDHAQGRTIYHHRIASPSVPFAGTAVPVSRGDTCSVEPGPATGCGLTDGDLLGDVAVQTATIDLGEAVDVGLVVVRSLIRVTVDVSADGVTYEPLVTAPLDGAPGVLAAGSAPVTARFVRVTAPDGGPMQEVSVWPPLPQAEVGVVPPDAAQVDAPPGADDDGDVPLVAVVVASALAGGVAVGAVGYWSRRKRSTSAMRSAGSSSSAASSS